MPEKSQKRKLRSDQSSSQENVEVFSQASDENTCLTDQDFSHISNKIENRLSKRLRYTEFTQREILRLIETLTSKVDNLSSPTSERSGPAWRFELETGPSEDLENNDISRNLSSNNCEKTRKITPPKKILSRIKMIRKDIKSNS